MCCSSSKKQYYFIHKDKKTMFPIKDLMTIPFSEIAEKLQLSVNDVYNQLNTIIKESNYKLFN